MCPALSNLPWMLVAVLCATLGLAPFHPEPHIWEKLKLLAAGDLVRPIDWLDLGLHGLPWALALAKLACMISRKTP
jgi:hypothetical protein